MPKYINADELKEKLDESYRLEHFSNYLDGKNDMIDEVEMLIDEMPSADVVEVKHGEWTYRSNPAFHINPEDAYCSICGFWVDKTETNNFDDYNFCPYCGADMRERKESE